MPFSLAFTVLNLSLFCTLLAWADETAPYNTSSTSVGKAWNSKPYPSNEGLEMGRIDTLDKVKTQLQRALLISEDASGTVRMSHSSSWYPDWQGEDTACVNDGKEPSFMTLNKAKYLFEERVDCCQKYYSWNYLNCIGDHGISGMKYFADWMDKNTCVNDGNAPSYMVNNPTMWLYESLFDCCAKNFAWKLKACIGTMGTIQAPLAQDELVSRSEVVRSLDVTCHPSNVRKIRIHATTGKYIQMFELQALSHNTNVALQGSAMQSSTHSIHSIASNAIDNNNKTFSHTYDTDSFWEVDLNDEYDIQTVFILNRWCRDLSDPTGCLCRLTNATLTLLDSADSVIAIKNFNNTCAQREITQSFVVPCLNPHPSLNPTKSPSCNLYAKKVKLESTTGNQLQMFEVQVISSGTNVALGKLAYQSSTFSSLFASRAVDGNGKTFSHTSDSNAYWEVDLGGMYSIEKVVILNRWCQNPNDPRACLCRLSETRLSLLDESNVKVTERVLGNTCGSVIVTISSLTTSECPTFSPSWSPSDTMLGRPSGSPLKKITVSPTETPSRNPSSFPFPSPSTGPSLHPTQSPILSPSASPTSLPTFSPSNGPSSSPSKSPTGIPSRSPSSRPSSLPTFSPSNGPSLSPSKSPTGSPSRSPSSLPSLTPSTRPSLSPSKSPTSSPLSSPYDFIFIGSGSCIDEGRSSYKNAQFTGRRFLDNEPSDWCMKWCSQNPDPQFVGIEVRIDTEYFTCLCLISGLVGHIQKDMYDPEATHIQQDPWNTGSGKIWSVREVTGSLQFECFSASPSSAATSPTSSPTTMGPVVQLPFYFVGIGRCLDKKNWYFNAIESRLYPYYTPSDCFSWCSQNPATELVGLEFVSLGSNSSCNCLFSPQIPTNINSLSYHPAGAYRMSLFSPDGGVAYIEESLSNFWCYSVSQTFPTKTPSLSPTTTRPTVHPTYFPTKKPTVHPTHFPTKKPTLSPTHIPTRSPSNHPSKRPVTDRPTYSPTNRPTMPPVVPLSVTKVGKGSCLDSQDQFYTVIRHRGPGGSPDSYCFDWCAQNPDTSLVGVTISRFSFPGWPPLVCSCEFSVNIPSSINENSYTPPGIMPSFISPGTGEVKKSGGDFSNYEVCYKVV